MFGDRIVFTSEAARGTPRYRFTYTRVSADALRIKLEIAPPGKDVVTYNEGGEQRGEGGGATCWDLQGGVFIVVRRAHLASMSPPKPSVPPFRPLAPAH